MKLSGLDLACIRGGRRVFSRVGFAITTGKALVLTGPNGAGKSSLLRMIAGLIRPAEGHIALEGGDPELSVAEQSHYVGHLDPIKPSLSVVENLVFWARFLGGKLDAGGPSPIERGLDGVGLADLAHLPAGCLSAGQRRRLSLARVLVVPRPIWLLDEPTTALDTASQDRLGRVMQDHLSGGGLVMAATHGPLGLAEAGQLRLGKSLTDSAEPGPLRDPDIMEALS